MLYEGALYTRGMEQNARIGCVLDYVMVYHLQSVCVWLLRPCKRIIDKTELIFFH